MKNTHGGAGRGQGRKSQYAEKLKPVTIRLTEAQKQTYKLLGGNQAVRDWLDAQADRLNAEDFAVLFGVG